MKKIYLLLLIVITGCGSEASEYYYPLAYGYENLYEEDEKEEEKEEEEEIISLTSQNFLADLGIPHISREKALYDFFYMVKNIEENFPFLDALYRVHDINFNEEVDFFYRRFPPQQYITLESYLRLLVEFLSNVSVRHVGHLQVSTPTSIEMTVPQAISYINQRDLSIEGWWLEAFTINPNTFTTYYALGIDLEALLNYTGYIINEEPNIFFYLRDIDKEYYELLEQSSTAYLRIHSFNLNHLHANREALEEFYRDIADLDNLIIDVRYNAGGFNGIWQELFLFANIDGAPEYHNLLPLFLRDNYLVREMLEDREINFGYTEDFDFRRFPYVEREDLKNLDIVIDFSDFSFEEPFEEFIGEGIAFDGNIYILAGPWSLSSTDGFARITRATGFATLVGYPSGGIFGSGEVGMGLVVHIPLPNTGLVFRMDLAYGINEVGRWNEEQGTLPDIWTMEGKSALGTALYHIARNRE